MTAKHNGTWRIIIASVATVAVLASLILSHAFDHLTGWLLLSTLFVQPLGALSTALVATRLSYLGRPKVRIWDAMKAQSLSLLILYLLPSRLSEFVKPLYLADRCDMGMSRVLAAVLCERLSDLLIVAAAVAFGAFYLAQGNLRSALPYWAAVGIVVVVSSALLMLRPGIFVRAIRLVPWPRLHTIMDRLIVEASAILMPRNIGVSLLVGTMAWASSYLMAYSFLSLGGSIPLTPGDAAVVFLAGTIGLIIGVAPGGLGTFEGAIVLALGHFGYAIGEALALAIGLRIASLMLPGTIGLLVLARERTGLRASLRQIQAFMRGGPPSQDPAAGSAGGAG